MAWVLPNLEEDFVGEYHSKLLEALEFLKDNQDSVGQAAVVQLLDAAGYFDAVNVEDALAEVIDKLDLHAEDGNLHPTTPEQVGAAPASHVGQGGTTAHPVASANGTAGFMSGLDKAKLDQLGFEAGSMTAAEILTALKTVDGDGSGLDADLWRGQDPTVFAPSSHVGAGGTAHPAATTTTAGFMASTDKTKLNGIEAGAQTQNANEVPIEDVAGNYDANNVEDALSEGVTKLSAHSQAGGSAHPTATTSAHGFISAADKTKLNGIESGATGDMTASEILDALKTVDGPGSGLDADTVDGQEAASFKNAYYKFHRSGSTAATPIVGQTWEIVMEPRTLTLIRVRFGTAPTVNTVINIIRETLGGTQTTLTSITVNANSKHAVSGVLSLALAEGDSLRVDIASGGTTGQNMSVVCKAT